MKNSPLCQKKGQAYKKIELKVVGDFKRFKHGFIKKAPYSILEYFFWKDFPWESIDSAGSA